MTKEEKIENLTDVVFDVLASGMRHKSKLHGIFVLRSIANSLYDMAPNLPSGLISVKAKEALQSGEISRSKLCKEHPYPRTRTSLDCINIFDQGFGKISNTEIKVSITESLTKGAKTHYVLSRENQALYPFQQDYTLSEDEIYSKAGVELVEDEIDIIQWSYIYKGKTYKMNQIDLAKELGLTKHRIAKMVKNKEIQKIENI